MTWLISHIQVLLDGFPDLTAATFFCPRPVKFPTATVIEAHSEKNRECEQEDNGSPLELTPVES